jgi:hypothetical protein
MPIQDASKIKEEIINFLNIKGPSLPIHIAQEIKISPLFTSAFLSELFSEKKIKMSYLRVGSSPVYFLSGQEEGLEKYADYLKSKEKEAFLFLKEKGILKDEEQIPAIRVALRAIKDFALPIEKNEEGYWKYFLYNEGIISKQENITPPSLKKEVIEKSLKIKKVEKKTPKKNEKNKKGNEKFLTKVKEFISKENLEITGIESISKEYLVLRVKINDEEKAFVAYNKKKITEKDFINANKKAEELGLKYILLSSGDLPKKIKDTIEAIKNLSGIEKIE